nr:PREDICTED: activating signal cointegrator 1 complex subunit 1-like [Bemisia tabaci]
MISDSDMEILRPKIINIAGRCYRVHNFVENTSNLPDTSAPGPYHELDENYDDDLVYEDKDEKDNLKIKSTPEGYKAEFHVARNYYPAIIGSKGAVRKRLETETKTHIKIPRLGITTGDIVITGSDANGVRRAYRRVKQIVEKVRKTQPATHFISIRCTSEAIKSNFLTFKKLVLEEYKSIDITESIFQVPEKLHLTIAVLVLSDTIERTKACQVFEECRDIFLLPTINGRKLTLNLKGLEIMNDDPSEVNVLYAKVKSNDDDLLQTVVDGIVSYFEDYGLLSKQYEKVKLHATLMNTAFDKRSEAEVDPDSKKRKTFDATKILRDLQDFEFGSTTFEGLDLSVRFSTGTDGYYTYSTRVNFMSCTA